MKENKEPMTEENQKVVDEVTAARIKKAVREGRVIFKHFKNTQEYEKCDG